jgi:hypothetical protein
MIYINILKEKGDLPINNNCYFPIFSNIFQYFPIIAIFLFSYFPWYSMVLHIVNMLTSFKISMAGSHALKLRKPIIKRCGYTMLVIFPASAIDPCRGEPTNARTLMTL